MKPKAVFNGLLLLLIISCSGHRSGPLIGMARWNVNLEKTLRVEFREKMSPSKNEEPRELLFFEEGKSEPIFREDNGDSFISMFTTGEIRGRFVLVAMGGTSYHFNAYDYSGEKVIRVLETGSKLMLGMNQTPNGPEVLTVYNFDKGQPESRETFSWDGSRYVSHMYPMKVQKLPEED